MTFARASICFAMALAALAQQGTAPDGYYPREYEGSIFTGEVIDGPLDVLTLRYEKGDKREIFTGRFEAPCAVPTKDSKMGTMRPSDIPLKDVVTAYYFSNRAKKNGQSATENVIIGILFEVVNGRPVKNRRGFQCSQQWTAVYKAFGGDGPFAFVPGPYQK